MMDFKDSEIRRILVPYDGSEQAQQAVRQAAHIARLQGATLMLLSVVDLNAEVAASERGRLQGTGEDPAGGARRHPHEQRGGTWLARRGHRGDGGR